MKKVHVRAKKGVTCTFSGEKARGETEKKVHVEAKNRGYMHHFDRLARDRQRREAKHAAAGSENIAQTAIQTPAAGSNDSRNAHARQAQKVHEISMVNRHKRFMK